MFQLSSAPLESLNLRGQFQSPSAGAFVSFEGWVRNRNDGKNVVALEYEAAEELCAIEADRILKEAKSKFHAIEARCFHRTGKLAIGDIAVWVGATAPHRDDAFKACRYIIDEVKHRLPIWKKEFYTDGNSGWVNCNHDVYKPAGHHSTQHFLGELPKVIEITNLSESDFKNCIFLDIRELSERQAAPIPEIPTVHAPMSQIAKKPFEFDAAKQYIIFCANGGRSQRFIEELHSQGIKNAHFLNQGAHALKEYFKNQTQSRHAPVA